MTDTPRSEALTPVGMTNALPATNIDNIANSSTDFLALRNNQQNVLLAIMTDFMSENIRSDVDMAKDLDIDRKTVYNCRLNATFNRALAFVMPELVKAKLPKYLAMIEKHGQKDYKPLELLLRYAGLYIPASQTQNLNVNMSAQSSANKPFSANVEDMLIRMGELGWTEDRVSELVPQFRKLKDEGAF